MQSSHRDLREAPESRPLTRSELLEIASLMSEADMRLIEQSLRGRGCALRQPVPRLNLAEYRAMIAARRREITEQAASLDALASLLQSHPAWQREPQAELRAVVGDAVLTTLLGTDWLDATD